MSESERPIVEEVLDYVVYAPLGIALTILEDLPGVVARGRSKVQTQVGVARFAGKLAFGQLRRTLDDILSPSRPSAQDAYGHDGPPVTSPPVLPTTEAHSTSRPASQASSSAASETSHHRMQANTAIPDYDMLAASQIVARLAGLNPAELHDVKVHEAQPRGRRTILARIDQLEQARDAR